MGISGIPVIWVACANPQYPFTVLVNRPDLVTAQGGSIKWPVEISNKFTCSNIKAVKPTCCTDPGISLVVVEQCGHCIIAEAFTILRIMLKMLEGFRCRVKPI